MEREYGKEELKLMRLNCFQTLNLIQKLHNKIITLEKEIQELRAENDELLGQKEIIF